MSAAGRDVGGHGAEARRLAGALLRLALGCAQMTGAAITLMLLLRDGLTAGVARLFVATTAVTVLSLVLFRRA